MIKDEIIEYRGQRWKIREAISMRLAQEEIDFARVTGSVGSKSTHLVVGKHEVTMADVVRVNSDDTEHVAGTTIY